MKQPHDMVGGEGGVTAPEHFLVATGVTPEVLERLEVYAELLRRWQPRINLVGPDTVPKLWSRHFHDSAQLAGLIPAGTGRLADLGTGAGFPGLVLAIMGVVPDVHLVESDGRKAAFLREVARQTETKVTIHVSRIEKLAPLMADVVTARALAPLVKLLEWAVPHLKSGGNCLFLKGRGSEDELTEAGKKWIFTIDRIGSLSDSSGTILRLGEIRRGQA